jgi:hypothetical protein
MLCLQALLIAKIKWCRGVREACPLGLRLFALPVDIAIEKSYFNSATPEDDLQPDSLA